MDEPKQPTPEEKQIPQQPLQPEPVQAKQGEPEIVRNIEAKLRTIPVWLMIVGALALGLAVGGIGYLLRGLMELLFGGTP